MSDQVRTELSSGVLTITLNRPERKNALTRAMYQALADAIGRADNDAEIRCVLLQAEGDMFTAGNDIADFAALNAGGAEADEIRRHGNPFLSALANAKKPIVAAV